jgi:GMP synthase-like glutamine amidotransferase
MKIHWFQHVPFEGLGAIEAWLLARGHTLTCTRFYAGESAPATVDDFDWLIVMGGPMNVYQYRDYPWLRGEKRVIREAVAANKRVLGVCLGAQLIADALGGKVYQNDQKEIGWFPITAVPEGAESPFVFPDQAVVFHWHGDTFLLPPGGVWLARSEACEHQAFAIGTRVLGLQFHVEMRPADVTRILTGCASDLTPGQFVQRAEEILAGSSAEGNSTSTLMEWLLGWLERE